MLPLHIAYVIVDSRMFFWSSVCYIIVCVDIEIVKL